jgi:hypothetical protein
LIELALNINIALVLLSNLILSGLQEFLDVLREEIRLESIDDIEEELSVQVFDGTIIHIDIWEILLQKFMLSCFPC